jgi:uncharacterized phage-associated protein
MYSANDIAKYAINRCSEAGSPISNLQLQKILYYIQGYFLAVFNTSAFEDEIYAWRLGPVVPDVYYNYNYFGADSIILSGESESLEDFTSTEKKLINAVIDLKSPLSAWKLVKDTHDEKPWLNTIQSEVISKECIKEYFTDCLRQQLNRG